MNYETFEKAWNSAATLDDVVEQTGYNRFYASRLAARLRADGYEMRAFKRGPALKFGAGIKHKSSPKTTGSFEPSEALAVQLAKARTRLVEARAEVDRISSLVAVQKAEQEELRKVDSARAIAQALEQGGRLK